MFFSETLDNPPQLSIFFLAFRAYNNPCCEGRQGGCLKQTERMKKGRIRWNLIR